MEENNDFKEPERKPDHAELLGLVRAARQDPHAFGELYLRYASPVFRYLCSRTGNVQEAEDLTSQTFMAAMTSISQLQQDERFSSWLFSIARNKAMDHFRRRQKQPEIIADNPPLMAEQRDLAAGLIQSDRVNQLTPLLKELDEKDLDLLKLRFLGELTFEEMAATLHRSLNAVKKSYYRLLARLKSQLEESHG